MAGARAQHLAPLYPAALAMVLCAIALALFGVAGTLLLSIGVLVVAGFSTDFYEVVGLTYFQNCLPDAVYARFLSLFLLALTAGGLVGAMAGPVLEQALGVGTSRCPCCARLRSGPHPGRHVKNLDDRNFR